MKLHRILPLAAAAVVFAACQAGDTTAPTFSAEDALRRNGVNMIGGGATSGPGEASQDGSQAGGSGGVTGGTTESSTSTDGTTTVPTDTTTTARGSHMGGSGG